MLHVTFLIEEGEKNLTVGISWRTELRCAVIFFIAFAHCSPGVCGLEKSKLRELYLVLKLA